MLITSLLKLYYKEVLISLLGIAPIFSRDFFLMKMKEDHQLKETFEEVYRNNNQWKLLGQLYNQYKQRRDFNSFVIPPIIHQIWLGPKPLPEHHNLFRKSIKAFHPYFTYKLWTDKDVENFELKNKKAYYATTNYGEKSDILRYEILERYGGIYFDDDFQCLKSFEYLCKSCEFFAGINGCEKTPIIFNGLIGSAPEHPIIKECINTIKRQSNAKDTYEEILHRTGPYQFTKAFFNVINILLNQPIVIFPSSYFYPWPYTEKQKNSITQTKSWIKPNSYAIHHWAVSWYKQKN